MIPPALDDIVRRHEDIEATIGSTDAGSGFLHGRWRLQRAATYDTIPARTPSARFMVGPTRGLCPDRGRATRRPSVTWMSLRLTNMGRMNWQMTSGYNTRSKVEAAMSRFKRVIGDTLKSRHDAHRATEMATAVKSLNRMNELGRAKFVRAA
jgi:hypothetical protein